ncbi:MAG: type I methionyl aminopeptidase [Candidatus Yanofskybacteria bacterium]|nr:type I methionyl aminopeptidase [Candidatus Yanofskybacteria bacterium]
MITLKSPQQVEIMRQSGAILAAILRELSAMPKVGVTTGEISARAAALIRAHGVEASFLHYNNYPDVICLSVNAQAVHTPGSDYALRDGDLLKLDFGVVKDGWQSDSAVTVLVASNPAAPEHERKRKLIQVTREALDAGIAQCRPGNTLGDIGHAIQARIERDGFTVVRELGGHGIGTKLHEEPWVANFGKPGDGITLKAGMVLALEPITSMGKWQIRDGADGFTYDMKDGSLSAHFEHTVAITENGPDVLTK